MRSVCNALALMQCVASHPDTRTLFLKAHIPLYLYPFLNTATKTRYRFVCFFQKAKRKNITRDGSRATLRLLVLPVVVCVAQPV